MFNVIKLNSQKPGRKYIVRHTITYSIDVAQLQHNISLEINYGTIKTKTKIVYIYFQQ